MKRNGSKWPSMLCGNLWPETEWWIMKKDETQNSQMSSFTSEHFSLFLCAFCFFFLWFVSIFKGILDLFESWWKMRIVFFMVVGDLRHHTNIEWEREKKSLSCQIRATWFIIIIHDSEHFAHENFRLSVKALDGRGNVFSSDSGKVISFVCF